ncbi:MAG: VWA domain-containing protein [bacterium]|nr:VWA domain-containing protein [bacterium]MBU1918832.1 VWA domain-containing protein [bacterium]
MKSNIYLFILCVIFMCTLSFSTFAKTDIEFIVDVSGSMKKISENETQIDSAKKALLKTLESIPQNTHLALRLYGHRIEQTNKAESCKDTELSVPFAQKNQTLISQKIQNLTPKGYTPIALSLEKSRLDFDASREADKVIILLSDGEETCGGDPIAVLEELKKQGFEVIVHTVGFNVDAKTRQQLMDISKTTGGAYFDAKGASALLAALEKATQASLVIDKEKTTYGTEIRGGDSYEAAVSLEKNTEYRLDHHQRKNEFDYFYIDLKPTQEITLTLKTLEKGVSLKRLEPQTNDNPYAGIQLHDSKRNNLKKKEIIGQPHHTEIIVYRSLDEQRYYILVGSSYAALNKDHVTFSIGTSVKGDLNQDKDAGDSIKTALPIKPGRYETNYLGGGGDTVDIFALNVQAGDQYYVGIIPNDEFKDAYFSIIVFDEFKQQLINNNTKYGEGLKTAPVTFKETGTYYLKIVLGGQIRKTSSYTLVLKKVVPQQNDKPL